MFVAVVGVLAVILIAATLCRGSLCRGCHPVACVLFGGALCLLGLLTVLSDEQQSREIAREIGLLLAFGAFLFGGLMIISGWEADETQRTQRQQSGEWVVHRKQLRDALAAETEPGKIALLKHDLEQHEANAPNESYIREALAAAEEKEADGAREN